MRTERRKGRELTPTLRGATVLLAVLALAAEGAEEGEYRGEDHVRASSFGFLPVRRPWWAGE
jgi:hypothetical protein